MRALPISFRVLILNDPPAWLYWIQYLSPFYWGFVGAAIPLMKGYDFGRDGQTLLATS